MQIRNIKYPADVIVAGQVMRTMLANWTLDSIMPKKRDIDPPDFQKIMDNTFDNEGQFLVEHIDTAEEREVQLQNIAGVSMAYVNGSKLKLCSRFQAEMPQAC